MKQAYGAKEAVDPNQDTQVLVDRTQDQQN